MTDTSLLRLPLLPSQTGMRDGHLQDPENSAYSVAQIVWFAGDELNEEMVTAAVEIGVRDTRSLLLRSGIDNEGNWYQELDPHAEIPVHRVDLSAEPDPKAAARELAYREVRRALPISGPELPFRSFVLTLGDTSFAWFGTCHHMFIDGYGATLLRARVGQALGALAASQDVPPSPLGDIVDLVKASPAPDPADLQFWRSHLEGAPEVISFADTVAPPAPLYEMLDFRTPHFVSRVAAVLPDVNWAHVAAAAAIAYISVTLENPGAVIGLPVTGRFTAEEKSTPSQSMGALPLHLTVDHDGTLPDLVTVFRDTVRSTKNHQRQSPDALRAELPTAWRTGRIYGPMVNVIPFEMPSMAGELETGLEVISHGPCDDISFTITPSTDEGIRTELLFNPGIYGPAVRTQHAERFGRWLDQVSAQPDAPLADLICLTPAEEGAHGDLGRTPAVGTARPLTWGAPCTVADLAAAAGLTEVSGISVLSELGRPSMFGQPGQVVFHTSSGDSASDLLVALDDRALLYRGTRSERVIVNGMHVELEAVRSAIARDSRYDDAEVTTSGRRITVRLGVDCAPEDRAGITARIAEVTAAPVVVR